MENLLRHKNGETRRVLVALHFGQISGIFRFIHECTLTHPSSEDLTVLPGALGVIGMNAAEALPVRGAQSGTKYRHKGRCLGMAVATRGLQKALGRPKKGLADKPTLPTGGSLKWSLKQ